MPSGKRNSITAKAMGLIFSLFDIASSQDVAFWHTAVRTMHASWTYLCPPLCPISLCRQPKVMIHGSMMHGFLTLVNGNRLYFPW